MKKEKTPAEKLQSLLEEMAETQDYSKQTRDSLIKRIHFLEERLKQASLSPYPTAPEIAEAAAAATDADNGETKPKKKKTKESRSTLTKRKEGSWKSMVGKERMRRQDSSSRI